MYWVRWRGWWLLLVVAVGGGCDIMPGLQVALAFGQEAR